MAKASTFKPSARPHTLSAEFSQVDYMRAQAIANRRGQSLKSWVAMILIDAINDHEVRS